MPVIFDEQAHPYGGLIFDEQEWSPDFGTSVLTVIPQATSAAGTTRDTDMQIVVYPQATTEYHAYQTIVVNGAVTLALTPNGSIAPGTPAAPNNPVFTGSAPAALTPAASFARGYGISGAISVALTPSAGISAGPNATTVYGAVQLAFGVAAALAYAEALVENGIPAITLQLGDTAERKRRKKTVNEGGSAVLNIAFISRGGLPVIPVSAIYQVDCPTTGTAVRAETALIPAATIALTLTAADNDIVDSTNVRELRRVTVEAMLPGGDTVNAQYDYLVINLSGVA